MAEQPYRPERQNYVVRAGAAEETAILPEWWGALDSEVESRRLRFPGEAGTWLEEEDLPESLQAAGCRVSEVVGVTGYPGLAHPSLGVGGRVLLRPEPTNPQDRNAIAVWTEDGSQQVGYLPGDIAAQTMAEAYRRGTGYGAFVAQETRDKESQERRGLMVFLGPGVVSAKETA